MTARSTRSITTSIATSITTSLTTSLTTSVVSVALGVAVMLGAGGCEDPGADDEGSSSNSNSGSGNQPTVDVGVCGRYIECVEATGEIVPGVHGVYSEQGTCWGDLDDESCWAACRQELGALRAEYADQPACTECTADFQCGWLGGTCDMESGVCLPPDAGDGTGPEAITECSLRVIDPSVADPIIAGDEAGKIPASVGDVLERNCGCHYTSSAPPPYVAFQGGTQLQTLANFRNPYQGANSTYAGQAAYEVVRDRVIRIGDMPMALCETEEGGVMSAVDRALLAAWLDADVPDGATFVPPAG